MPSTHASSSSAASEVASPRLSSDSYDDISIMKGEEAHKEHKSSSGLSSTLKKVKAKFHSEAPKPKPKPKPKSPYTRNSKLADTVFAYRVMAETRM